MVYHYQRWSITTMSRGACQLHDNCLVPSAHTCLIDLIISDALRTVSGYLCPSPVDNLVILTCIQPAEFQRKRDTMSLARHAMEPEYVLQSALTCSPGGNAWHPNSRNPFVFGNSWWCIKISEKKIEIIALLSPNNIIWFRYPDRPFSYLQG